MTTLTIGREPAAPGKPGGRLRIQMPNGKELAIAGQGPVPMSVSRTHCRLTMDDQGGYAIENLKVENETYVNGVAVMKKAVRLTDRIELGSGRYPIDLQEMLEAIRKVMPQEVSVCHLQEVWDRYQADKIGLQVRQNRSAAVQSVTGILSMSSIACGFVPGIPSAIKMLLYVVALCLALFFCIRKYMQAGKFPAMQQELDRQFRSHYVCPNDQCGRFLGYVPYDELVKTTKQCPLCHAIYREKA